MAIVFLLLVLVSACKRTQLVHHEYVYVSAAETSLRDRVATLYNKVATVQNGDRLEVLDKQRRFFRVRTDDGKEGWVEERSLANQEVFDGFQQLAKDNANLPAQAHGTTRAELNMHVAPSREAEHLYQLKDGEKVEILKRATAEKNPPKAIVAAASGKSSIIQPSSKSQTPPSNSNAAPSRASAASPQSASPASETGRETPPPKPIMEDWYLVHTSGGHVGWVLLRMVDLDIPLEVAQYAEGQRIMGYFLLNTVEDQGKQVGQYLVLLNEPKDGLAWDFNQVRVFTWNRARHHYETAYRERNLQGYFPVKTGHQDFGKEGELPTFTIRTKNDDGQLVERTYKLNGPIVRRVLTPEEEAAEKVKHQPAAPPRHAQAQQSAHRHRHHKKS